MEIILYVLMFVAYVAATSAIHMNFNEPSYETVKIIVSGTTINDDGKIVETSEVISYKIYREIGD